MKTIINKDYQPETQSEYEKYLIYSRAEILGFLKEIDQKKLNLVIFFDQNQQTFSSTILNLDPQKNEIIVDCSHNPGTHQSLLDSKKIVFVTFIELIKIQFILNGAQEKTIEDGKPALKFSIPESLMRLQRRNHFRVQTPKGQPIVCFVPMSDHPDRGMNVDIFDISLGGVAMMQAGEEVRLAPGMIFPRCRMNIPDVGELITDIEIRHVPEADERGIRSIGCKFVNIPANMVNVLQRYIIQVERAKRVHN